MKRSDTQKNRADLIYMAMSGLDLDKTAKFAGFEKQEEKKESEETKEERKAMIQAESKKKEENKLAKTEKVFIVSGKSGEYSEIQEWVQGVYPTQEAAQEAMKDLNEKATAFFRSLEEGREEELRIISDEWEAGQFIGDRNDYELEEVEIYQKYSPLSDENKEKAREILNDMHCEPYHNGIEYMWYPANFFKEKTPVKAWVIIGSVGMYEDTTTWCQGVYLDYKIAKEKASELDKKALEFIDELDRKKDADEESTWIDFNNGEISIEQRDDEIREIFNQYYLESEENAKAFKKHVGDKFLISQHGQDYNYHVEESELHQ